MTTPLVVYEVTLTDLTAVAEKYASLEAKTKEGYEQVRLAIADVRRLRVQVEKRRVELKADALAYGREVDAIAKSLTEQLEAIEQPMRLGVGREFLKAGVDEEKQRAKAEKEAAALAAQRAQLEAERQRLAEEAAELVDELLEAHAVSIEEHSYSPLAVIENDTRMTRLRLEMIALVSASLASGGGT